MMAKSETNSVGFSTKSVMMLFSSNFTTPKELGLATLCTQITPSFDLSRLNWVRNRVSAKATITSPLRHSRAQSMAWPVPSATSW